LLFRKKGRDDGLLGPVKTEKTRQTEREKEKRRKTFKLLFAVRQSMNV